MNFQGLAKQIHKISRTEALFKDFPGHQNETKTFQHFQGTPSTGLPSLPWKLAIKTSIVTVITPSETSSTYYQ